MQRLSTASRAASTSSSPSTGVTASTGISAYSASVPSGQSASTGSAAGPIAVSPIRIWAGSSTFSRAAKCDESTTRRPGSRCHTSRPTASTTPTALVPIVNAPGGGL